MASSCVLGWRCLVGLSGCAAGWSRRAVHTVGDGSALRRLAPARSGLSVGGGGGGGAEVDTPGGRTAFTSGTTDLDYRRRSSVALGTDVMVVQKADQRTGKLTAGVVSRILTNSNTHPHGIKVRLRCGRIGRVQVVGSPSAAPSITTTTTTNTNTDSNTSSNATAPGAVALGDSSAGPAAEFWQLGTREDNYVYFAVPTAPTDGRYPDARIEVAVIDPSCAEPVLQACDEMGWTISQIINTHHHHDHVGGNLAIKAAHGAVVVGPSNEEQLIPGVDIVVDDGDTLEIAGMLAECILTPGHTSGHVSFHISSASVLLCGDTLFALGCGRLFEGTPVEMHTSLGRFNGLDDETLVLCGHEYTQSNAKFCLAVEPDSADLRARAASIDELRAQDLPTVPSTLGEERRTNCFLRTSEPAIKAAVGLQPDADPAAVFAALRSMKDSF